jgi:outer membrane immunogenic protein
MKKIFLACVAAISFASGAQSADLGVPRGGLDTVVVAPSFNWTGFYAGAHIGLNSLSGRYTYLTTPLPAPIDALAGQQFSRSAGGVLGGVQIGYNWQAAPNLVVGLEGAVSLSSARSNFQRPPTVTQFGAPDNFRIANTFLGNVAVRVGYAAGRALIFGKFGLAVGTFSFREADPALAPEANYNVTRAGLLLGVGAEYAIMQNVTISAEYNYNYFGSFATRTTGLAFDIRTRADVHVGKISINYLFSTGPAAVVARY